MDTRTIILVGLGFLGGVCVVSAIAYVIGKFRSLRSDLESQEHQLYAELERRGNELVEVARDIRGEIQGDVRNLREDIEGIERASMKRDEESERLMCERVNNLSSELDSRMDKHMAKHHPSQATAG